jgi:6-pyruvoyltetrahydropterin/6-carboxytetrahydropterin synthase
MFKITKEFKFEYAHALKLDYNSPCTNVHGHSAVVKVTLYSTKLNKSGMIIDFKDLKFIQEYLDTNFDHRLILQNNTKSEVVTKNISITITFVNDNPTAENLAKLIGTYISNNILRFCEDIYCIDVEFFETAKNSATYTTMCGEGDDDHKYVCDECNKVGSENATGCDGNCEGKNTDCCRDEDPCEKCTTDVCDGCIHSDDEDPCDGCEDESCVGCQYNDDDCEGCTEDDCKGCAHNDEEDDEATNKDNESDEDIIFIEITKKGSKYLKLEKESAKFYYFLEFIDNACVSVPTNQDIDKMMSAINYQFYEYEDSDKRSFVKDDFLNCLTKGYIQFSL